MNEHHLERTALRHAFHHDPELGFQEHRAKAKVAAYPPRLGIEVQQGVGVAGVLKAVTRAASAAGLEADGNRPPMSFSEDVAHFSAAVPGCFLLMGHGTDGPHGQPLHAADDDSNDAPLPHGAAFRAALVGDRVPARKD